MSEFENEEINVLQCLTNMKQDWLKSREQAKIIVKEKSGAIYPGTMSEQDQALLQFHLSQ